MSNSDPSDFLQGLDVATTLTQTVPFKFHSNTPSHGGFPEQFFGQAFSLWKEQGAEALKEEFNDLWLKAGLVNSAHVQNSRLLSWFSDAKLNHHGVSDCFLFTVEKGTQV